MATGHPLPLIISTGGDLILFAVASLALAFVVLYLIVKSG